MIIFHVQVLAIEHLFTFVHFFYFCVCYFIKDENILNGFRFESLCAFGSMEDYTLEL